MTVEQVTKGIERLEGGPPSRESESGPHRMCRVGNLLWKLPKNADASEPMSSSGKRAALESVCNALEEDSRVVEVIVPSINPDFTGSHRFYPDLPRTSRSDLFTGEDRFGVMKLSNPILFKVHVPKKNQPAWHGYDNIPTEDYFVSWDGVTAFVAWEQDSDHIPLPGGQIVADILDSALAAHRAELYIQACSPICHNIFFHTDLYLRPADPCLEDGTPITERRHAENAVDISIPRDMSMFDTLNWLSLYLRDVGDEFAVLKNLSRRVMDIESLIRDEMTHLLGHYYEHAVITTKPLWRSLKARWQMRWWRREARQILAGLWLSLANAEGLRRNWEDSRREFDDEKLVLIFESDYSDDIAVVSSLEMSHLDATIEQISRNLDNNAVVLATVLGALAGGLAGALIGLIH